MSYRRSGAEEEERVGLMNERPVLAIGSVFHEYRVTRYVGQGLHGQVFEVAHLHTGEPFALKVMHLEDRNDVKKVQRALATAKGTYTIQHANVVRVHNLSCEPDGMVWLLMEMLTGRPLSRILGHGRQCSPLFALDVAIEIAWGLDAAHEVGIIHRDIKPDNVFITAEGVVKVIDFSIAKVIPAGIQTTRRGYGMGTAHYMAPDNIRGGEPDARFDVYALGILLWELLAGYHPFHDAGRDTNEIIRRQAFVELGPLSLLLHLPEYLDALIRRATAKDPNARFFSMAELAKEMQRVREQLESDAAGQRIVLRRPPPGEPMLRNPLAHRESRSARVPDPEPAPPMPAERVILEDGITSEALKATMPLPSNVGPGGTVPLRANEIRAAVDNLTRAPEPSVPRETPQSVTRTTPPEPPPAPVPRPSRRARSFGIILVLALAASVITWIVVLRAVGVHRGPAVTAELPPLPSLTVTPPTPEPVPVPVPSPAPSGSTMSAAPTATASTVAKRAPAHPESAKPAPSAPPAPTFKPLFGE